MVQILRTSQGSTKVAILQFFGWFPATTTPAPLFNLFVLISVNANPPQKDGVIDIEHHLYLVIDPNIKELLRELVVLLSEGSCLLLGESIELIS